MTATADPASILVVDDEEAIRGVVTFTLSRIGHLLEETQDCTSARFNLETRVPDLMILDWMLPDQSGIEFLRELRRNPRTRKMPVIMLTAKTDERDKITALRSGADDYITKPFSRDELVLRVAAMLRRCRRTQESSRMRYGPLLLDSLSHRVMLEDRDLNLGRMEFRLLRFMMLSPDRVFSRAQLLDRVWQTNGHVEERTIDVHIMRLRAALGRESFGPCIQTVRGLGYRFSPRIFSDYESTQTLN